MLSEKFRDYINILKMTRKPDREEFVTTLKVSVAVMLVIGLIGFIVYLLMDVLPGYLG
ncbi:protein translocase SEC61 complex subunit gamma [Geoglobus acetivorans]|uniref:Protein translocase subunit SecE n=1 Tax=Geoglobus acetivorans TaxID=565033 RepID=A0A0A7GE95_GEOAI|nr:Preprotein translocase subunit SecE [Geoglobus acetivorans]MBE8540226.1 protein translocase SEC61 complex subunit gamma [Geoglobus acetivorans]